MFALIGEVLNWIRKIAQVANKIRQFIMKIRFIGCAIQTLVWLSTLKSILRIFKSLNLDFGDVAKIIGVNEAKDLFKDAKTFEEAIHNIKRAEESFQEEQRIADELERRSKAPESPWNGTHTPNYDSTVFTEVIYKFDNVLGTGTMILIFNPIGFGNKLKDPQIIRYVGEQEFGAFIKSESWGNYWRENFLLRRPKHFNRETEDLITGEHNPSPRAESLVDYSERALNLPDGEQDVISAVFQEEMIQGLQRQETITKDFINKIEKGTWGRELTEKGVRLGTGVQETKQAIFSHKGKLLSQNIFASDILQSTGIGKAYINRLRNVKTMLGNASLAKEFTGEITNMIKSNGLLKSIRAGAKPFIGELTGEVKRLGGVAVNAFNASAEIKSLKLASGKGKITAIKGGFNIEVVKGKIVGLPKGKLAGFLDNMFKGIKEFLKPPKCLFSYIIK